MKTILLTIGFAVFSIFGVMAQCPTSDLTIGSQAQLDNFKILYPNCTEFGHSITVDGPSITNLNGLSNLTKLYSLYLAYVDVTSLSALSNLVEVSNLGIAGCLSLTSLAGLEGLKRIEYGFMINESPIASLEPLSNVTFMGSLNLRASTLTNLHGLENVKEMMSLSLVSNPSLENIDAIDNVKFVDDRVLGEAYFRLELVQNDLLTDCSNEVVCHAALTDGAEYINWFVQGNGEGCTTKAQLKEMCIEALPVQLVNFEGMRLDNGNVQLTWATTSEVDSKSFEIQTGYNGRSWATIGKVNAQGQSGSTIQYTFTDKHPLNERNLYRLKMVDIDNTFTFSKIINVKNINVSEASIYPNPVTENVRIPGAELISSAKILDINGKEIYKSAGNPGSEISTKQLPAGVFILSLEKQDGSISRFKFVKK
ncbi:T9SS type A sorting domain-containing protein [Dyadobacter luticola]|uniref:T9SS type A sorting domain-containing protein n=1 Tax=Dyadobacter luticola TaxID=1979387 RepID=A0A5R9L360_9BACT|nr:T9SS type A sorting domain-containing protein [Dyadobacter luticola]TLV03014.1 T9SS type A sorting domain-containing protein [Dyadobacter luticola]